MPFREHRIYSEYAGFERFGDGATVKYRGGGAFDGHKSVRFYLALAVERRAERVHHSADYAARYRNARGFARSVNFIARGYSVLVEQNNVRARVRQLFRAADARALRHDL